MITMQEFMELIDYKITEGSSYGWDCYGKDAYSLSCWNGLHDGPTSDTATGGVSLNIVFSTQTQEVYQVEVCDYTNDRGYRMIHPDHVEKHTQEAEERAVEVDNAWDDVEWTNLELEEDFMQKAKAIIEGEDYNTDVGIPLDFSDEELLVHMKAAHKAGLSFNDYITRALREVLDKFEDDPDAVKAEVAAYKKQYNKD